MTKFEKTSSEKFSRLDIFGQPVELTYKADNKYRTPVGACLSIVMITFLVGFIGYDFA
jgi:hypothetical protein